MPRLLGVLRHIIDARLGEDRVGRLRMWYASGHERGGGGGVGVRGAGAQVARARGGGGRLARPGRKGAARAGGAADGAGGEERGGEVAAAGGDQCGKLGGDL